MQPIWNGDRRDRVKWGAIYHLAAQHNIREIVWVLFYRDLPDKTLQTDDGPIPIPNRVWSHFSDFNRIQELWNAGQKVHIFHDPFEPCMRREYIGAVITYLGKFSLPRLVFLDPDTGIAPSVASAQHVTERDIYEIWNSLMSGDMLLIYQHAGRNGSWLEQSRKRLQKACGGVSVSALRGQEIAGDVAILWATRNTTQ